MASAKQEAENAGVIIRPNLENYVKGRSGSGKRTMRTNDPIAEALDGFELDEVYAAAAKATGIKRTELEERYGHLNPGMQRMNLGNRIRGVVAKADKEHASDNSKPTGESILAEATAKGRAAADKRAADADAARAKREEEAAAKAAAKADAPAKKKSPKGKGKSKAA